MADNIRQSLKKRSFTIAGHRTSVALEPEFWSVLEAEAVRAGQALSAFVAGIDAARGLRPLASALRLAALDSSLQREREPG
ncbi:MAG TPA: ribbon-helix-helix domain-containing protein [Rhizomicrobium sp.]